VPKVISAALAVTGIMLVATSSTVVVQPLQMHQAQPASTTVVTVVLRMVFLLAKLITWGRKSLSSGNFDGGPNPLLKRH
jgi:hypothetical protein